MKKFKISTALNYLLVSFIFLVVLSIFYSMYLSNELSELSSLIYNHPLAVTNEIKDIHNNLDNMQNISDNIKFDETGDAKSEMVKIALNEKNIENSFSIVQDRFSGSKDLSFGVEITFYEYMNILRKNLRLKMEKTGEPDSKKEDEILSKLKNDLNLLYHSSRNNASLFYTRIDDEKSKLNKSLYGFLFISILYGLSFLYIINFKVKQPISSIIEQTEKLFEEYSLTNKNVPAKNDIELLVFTIDYLENIRGELKKENEIRKKTEAELLYLNKEMKNTMLSKDKLFSIIAHDLINPFNAIIGLSGIIKNNLNEYSSEEIKRLLDDINKSAISQYALLQNLLNWSRSQIGELRIEKELFNLKRIIDEAFESVDILAKSKDLSLVNETNPEDYVYSDRKVLAVVLNNLITNAVKYSFSGNKILVYSNEDNYYTTIYVKDYGTGISSDKLESVFSISGKIPESGTNGEKGSGLGLLICKEFIEKQEGKIWAESELNSGSTFCVSLPKGIFKRTKMKFS